MAVPLLMQSSSTNTLCRTEISSENGRGGTGFQRGTDQSQASSWAGRGISAALLRVSKKSCAVETETPRTRRDEFHRAPVWRMPWNDQRRRAGAVHAPDVGRALTF
jgi:hypothetical protein